MESILKTLAAALALITLFSAVLVGGAYALAASPARAKEYKYNDFVDASMFVMENTPIPQSDMQNKFNKYNTVEIDESDALPGGEHKTRLTYFSEDEAASLNTRRNSGEIFTLTFDEILFIINDSVQAYFTHDTIVLTNVLVYNIITDSPLSSNALVITCYHGDFSELEYNKAVDKYKQMLSDIYDIIVYRMTMLDSTFTQAEVFLADDMSEWLVLNNDFSSASLIFGKGDYGFDSINADPPVPFKHFKVKILEEDTLASDLNGHLDYLSDEYAKFTAKQRKQISGTYYPDDLNEESIAPMLFACNISASDGKRLCTVANDDQLTETVLFPTDELNAMRPDLSETKPESSRSFFEFIANELYPEYDIKTPAHTNADDFLKAINEERLKGMTFRQLVDTFGLPYNGKTSGLCTGCYYLSDGGTITIYFDGDFNVDSYLFKE